MTNYKLKITIIDAKTQKEHPATNYKLQNDKLFIPELGCAYFFSPRLIDITKPFFYTDSVYPINKPDKPIIKKYIKVEVIP